MYDMMVGKCPAEYLLNPENPQCLTNEAVSIIYMFLEKDPTLRLGASDTSSILMHPFFKAVNWEAVLQKRVKPPVKPVNSVFVIVHQEAPDKTDESQSEISSKLQVTDQLTSCSL
jgi:hypothetical protein